MVVSGREMVQRPLLERLPAKTKSVSLVMVHCDAVKVAVQPASHRRPMDKRLPEVSEGKI